MTEAPRLVPIPEEATTPHAGSLSSLGLILLFHKSTQSLPNARQPEILRQKGQSSCPCEVWLLEGERQQGSREMKESWWLDVYEVKRVGALGEWKGRAEETFLRV
jgi:hypothetical protein